MTTKTRWGPLKSQCELKGHDLLQTPTPLLLPPIRKVKQATE